MNRFHKKIKQNQRWNQIKSKPNPDQIKSITLNIFRIQSDDYIICGFYCIAFIEYMITGKGLLDYQKKNKIIYKYLKDKNDKRKIYPWNRRWFSPVVRGFVSISAFA